MFELRPARESDALALAEISERTFVETFAKDNRPEDIAEYVSNTFGFEKQLAEIQDSNRSITIAWEGSHPAGFYHLLDGPPDPTIQGPRPIELLRLYVASAWHGKGLGPMLMNRCIEEARVAGFKTLWLGVWEKNFRAQAFYRKFDFVPCGTHIFQLGKDAQTDLVLSRKI